MPPNAISGLVLVTTLDTCIGTALVHADVLIANSELGHVEIDGKDAETVASSGVKASAAPGAGEPDAAVLVKRHRCTCGV